MPATNLKVSKGAYDDVLGLLGNLLKVLSSRNSLNGRVMGHKMFPTLTAESMHKQSLI